MMVDPVTGTVWGCRVYYDGGDPVTGTVWGCRVYYDGRPCNWYSLGV